MCCCGPTNTRRRLSRRTWREIHTFVRNLLPGLTGDSRLLVKQFTQFLEYSGMSGFTGFQREHFDYFLLHDDDDARRWVWDQVEDFAARVQTRLQKELGSFYESYHVGKSKASASHCWVAFGPDPLKECEHFASVNFHQRQRPGNVREHRNKACHQSAQGRP